MTDPTAPKQHNSGNLGGLDPNDLSKDLEAKFPSIKSVPHPERLKMVQMVVERSITISGPLPAPSILEAYNQIEPHMADRIVAMAESDQKHEQNMQKLIVQSEISAQARDHVYHLLGLGLALIALIGMMALVGFLAINNQTILAGLFGVGGMGAIVTAFINGRSKKAVEKPLSGPTSSKQSKKKK
jgi:uncharacterized membrane protein